MIERQHGAGQEAGSYHAFPLIYDDAWIRAGQQDIAEALKAATTEADRTRVQYFGYTLEALRLYLEYHQATLRFDFPATKAAYDAMNAHWEKTYKINTDLVANEAPAYLKRFLGRFVEEGLKYSSAPYRMLQRLPDELPTLFDPNEVGYRLNYQNPAVNDDGFVRTKTYSSTWDAQGFGGDVARARAEVEQTASRREGGEGDGHFSPADILPAGHQPIHEIVSARDAGEHVLNVNGAFCAGEMSHVANCHLHSQRSSPSTVKYMPRPRRLMATTPAYMAG